MNYKERKVSFLLQVSLFLIATLPDYKVDAMAPNFFSSTPKSIPPIGKREVFRSMGLEAELRQLMSQHMISTLNQVLPFIDKDEDGAISIEELVQIPVIRKALQADWKEVLIPGDQRRYGSLFNLT